MNIKQKKQDETAVSPAQYAESDAVKQARVNLTEAQKPAAYQSQWQKQLSDTMAKIQNRQPFSYDINGDALYDQYKNQYIGEGKQAMEDTIGKAASMTGGYGNSYAVTAGNQAYQGYLGKLNDVIPELYQMALDRYIAEGDSLMQNYSLLADREAEDYARWRDSVEDQRYDAEWQYQRERDAVDDARYAEEWAYTKDRDAISDARYADETAYAREQDSKNWEYQRERDTIDDWRYADEWAYAKSRDTVNDARYADETKYAREQDSLNYALSMLKADGEEETTKYTPYGEYTAGEFIEKLGELAAEYSEAEQYGADGSAAIRSAVALTNAIGTDEAMNAFREVFGDDVYKNNMVYTERMREFEAGMKTEREVAGRGIDYGDYYMKKVLSALDRNELDENEAATLLDEHGLIERFNDEYDK